jgi:hypothetical protein
MSRESPYATSHKGLRNAIGRFQFLAGRTRYDDAAELAELKSRGAELALLLTHHLVNEDRFFLSPLRSRAEAEALHDLHDHAQLEPVQAAMIEALRKLHVGTTAAEGHAFYLQVTEFHSRYLAHILHEERVTEGVLFDRFTEAEVAQMTADLMKAVELPVLIASLRYILPAQPLHESQALLARLREAPFFADVLAAVKSEMTPADYEQLVGSLKA